MKIMKQILCAGLSLVMILGSGLSTNALNYGEEWSSYSGTTTTSYNDVPSNYWAYDAIMRTSAKKWFGGYPDGSFMPEASITRAEALKVFVTFLGLELNDVKQSSFYDVDANEWYAPYIEAGKDLLPTHTTIQGKTPFNPDMPITREDTIYALVKALGCNLSEKYVDQSVLNMFQDQNSISGGVKSFFAIALNHKLVSGYPDGTIRAQDPLARAEFATLLLRGTEHGFHDKYEAKIQSVTITPTAPIEMEIGETVTLSARATYTDGTSKEYNDLQPYDASGNGVITLSGKQIKAQKEGTATIKYNGQYLENETTVISVKKPTYAPKLKITDYPDETEEETAQINGKVTDESGSDIDLTCNGKDVSVQSNGNFTAEVRLNDGKNQIELIAENAYGNQTSKTIVIEKITMVDDENQDSNSSNSSNSNNSYDDSDDYDDSNSNDSSDDGDGFIVPKTTSLKSKDGVPLFDHFIGADPVDHFENSVGTDVYQYDAWDFKGESVYTPIQSYLSYVKQIGYSVSNEKDENSCLTYELKKGNIYVEFVYDYLLGYIKLRIDNKE